MVKGLRAAGYDLPKSPEGTFDPYPPLPGNGRGRIPGAACRRGRVGYARQRRRPAGSAEDRTLLQLNSGHGRTSITGFCEGHLRGAGLRANER